MLRALHRAALVVPLLASGCAHQTPEYEPVADEDYGRLSPSQLAPVDAVRQQRDAASDAVAHAKLDLGQAQNEVKRAQAEQAAAKADQQSAKAEQDAAQKSNDPAAKARAQELTADADLRARTAQAHATYAQRLSDARQAEVDAAEKQVKLRDAEVDRAKLTALSQANIPAATKYNAATFDAHVAEAQRDYQQAHAKSDDALHRSQQAHNSWATLDDQYRTRVHAQPAETGSASPAQSPGSTGTSGGAEAPAAPPSP